VKAFESGQMLQKEGKLLAASEALVGCFEATCPPFLSKECSNVYAEVQVILPSITLRATDGQGRLLREVRVLLDGRLIAQRLGGRTIPLDPGVHQLRFENAHRPPVTTEVLIAEGVKNRLVSVKFSDAETEPASKAAAAGASAVTPPPAPPAKASPPIAAYVTGGVGVLALAGG
jgi:hypothetical protein